MNKVRDDFDMITYETDSILYYNPEDLYDSETKEKIRQAREEAIEKGRQEGIKETAKKMKELNISVVDISYATGLDVEEIEKL